MHYLGIDGGGSKTHFYLMDQHERRIREYMAGSCYYPDIGKEGLFRLLDTGIRHCIQNIDPDEIHACAGIPLYGELESLMRDLQDIKTRLPVKIQFLNDVEVGYYGSIGFDAGIHIVAGTGSIAIGFDEAGHRARSGGFGYEMHCDEGSAYDIGLSLVKKFTRQSDGREDKTLLYEGVRRELGLSHDLDIIRYMVEDIKMDRSKVASLAPLAARLALQGDTACAEIFHRAAQELYLLAYAVMRQLSFKHTPVKVSYSGGVFQVGDLLLNPLKKLLAEGGMQLVKPANTPVYGACMAAKRHAGL